MNCLQAQDRCWVLTRFEPVGSLNWSARQCRTYNYFNDHLSGLSQLLAKSQILSDYVGILMLAN